ncbi:MAG: hypothetical protein ACFE7R_01365 [Candidatus Hodarchaeota archaeon]
MPKRSRCPYCGKLFNRDVLDDHIPRCRGRKHIDKKSEPPKRKLVIVDGNNIAFHLSPSGKPMLDNLILAVRSLSQAGLIPTVVVSAALIHKIDKPQGLLEMISEGQVVQAPRGTNDDFTIIRLAMQKNADIVSNDRFLDWVEKYSWLPDRIKRYRMTPTGLILV